MPPPHAHHPAPQAGPRECGALASRWTPWSHTSAPESLPPMGDDFHAFRHSVPVLATDGVTILVAYLQVWTNDDYAPSWKIAGRDGYDFVGVTHWMLLPLLPNAGE